MAVSGSPSFATDATDWSKNLRDLGFAVAAAAVGALIIWLSGIAKTQPDAFWVAIVSPLLVTLQQAINRWQRDNTASVPSPPADPAKTGTDWDQMN